MLVEYLLFIMLLLWDCEIERDYSWWFDIAFSYLYIFVFFAVELGWWEDVRVTNFGFFLLLLKPTPIFTILEATPLFWYFNNY